jgi:hypothetical protein
MVGPDLDQTFTSRVSCVIRRMLLVWLLLFRLRVRTGKNPHFVIPRIIFYTPFAR